MAAFQRATAGVGRVPSENPGSPQEAAGPRTHIARLAELHDEWAETALLANLLGRVPYLATALLVAACATVWSAHGELAPLLTWLTLVGAGLIALIRTYVITIAAPFERAPLRFFARDLQAVMLYVGFAWGAGSFLALSPNASTLEMVTFGAGAIALVAAVARASDIVVCFGTPVTVLSVAAALLNPVTVSVFAAAAMLVSGFGIIAIAYAAERTVVRAQTRPFAAFPAV